ncbi:MAG: DUF1800 domain-containing protein [Actinomycetota bacterium]
MAIDATPRNAAHLLRRAAWGGRPDEILQVVDVGIEAAVDALLDPSQAPVVGEPVRFGGIEPYSPVEFESWFVRLAATSPTPAIERLAWFWSGHFATGIEKVEFVDLMHRQLVMLRRLGLGRFDDLLKAVTRDAAMNIWLDLNLSTVGNPNENFARELMELFSMGIDNGYTQSDVVNAARALTGYQLTDHEGTGRVVGTTLHAALHDHGLKTLFGETGPFDGDDVVDMITNRRECHEFIARRMWHRYAGTSPAAQVVSTLANAFGARLSIDDLLRTMLTLPQFYDDDVQAGLVSQPLESIVRVVRGFDLPVYDAEALSIEEADETTGPNQMPPWIIESWGETMGQRLASPPNVAGWPHNAAWLDSNRAAGRLVAGIEMGHAVAEYESPALERLWSSIGDGARLTAELMAGMGVVEWTAETESAIAAAAGSHTVDDPYQSLVAAFAVAFTSPEVTLA